MNQKKLDNLHKLIKLSSKSFVYFFESGLKNYHLDQYEEAISDFNEALRLNFNHKESLFHRGLTKHFLGKNKEAISDFDKASGHA